MSAARNDVAWQETVGVRTKKPYRKPNVKSVDVRVGINALAPIFKPEHRNGPEHTIMAYGYTYATMEREQ